MVPNNGRSLYRVYQACTEQPLGLLMDENKQQRTSYTKEQARGYVKFIAQFDFACGAGLGSMLCKNFLKANKQTVLRIAEKEGTFLKILEDDETVLRILEENKTALRIMKEEENVLRIIDHDFPTTFPGKRCKKSVVLGGVERGIYQLLAFRIVVYSLA